MKSAFLQFGIIPIKIIKCVNEKSINLKVNIQHLFRTISCGRTIPGSILLAAENNLGMCLSLLHRLQLPVSFTEMLGNCSKQIKHLTDCRVAISLWKSVILAITSGLLNCGNLCDCCGSWVCSCTRFLALNYVRRTHKNLNSRRNITNFVFFAVKFLLFTYLLK